MNVEHMSNSYTSKPSTFRTLTAPPLVMYRLHPELDIAGPDLRN